jgi:hypothetical protein
MKELVVMLQWCHKQPNNTDGAGYIYHTGDTYAIIPLWQEVRVCPGVLCFFFHGGKL